MSGDLCVFWVDNGSTHEFSVERYVGAQVDFLQQGICSELGIDPTKQVLIMENGVHLQSNKKLAQYSCGTEDSNPIFLFSKDTIQNTKPPPAFLNRSFTELTAELRNELDRLLSQRNASLDLVQNQTNLAARVVDLDKKVLEDCVALVRDQKLQHQGWMAAVCNLNAYIKLFEETSNCFFDEVAQKEDQLKQCQDLLLSWSETITRLKSVPIPASVFNCLPGFEGSNSIINTISKCSPFHSSSCDNSSTSSDGSFLSLYDYLCSIGPVLSLDSYGPSLQYAIENYNEENINKMKDEIQALLLEAKRPEMQIIRNFQERMKELDVKMKQGETIIELQSNILNSFVMQNERLRSVGDRSVLADLCEIHTQQLRQMAEQHNKLLFLHNGTKLAKEELANNLHGRLKWMTKTQMKIDNYKTDIEIKTKLLGRIPSCQLLEQAHSAPEIAVQTLIEVQRRNSFSKSFIKRGKELSDISSEELTVEMNKRLHFAQNTSHHFIYSVFPFLEEPIPVESILKCPDFDVGLPEVHGSDIDMLRQKLPELEHLFHQYDSETSCLNFNVKNQSAIELKDITVDKVVNGDNGEHYHQQITADHCKQSFDEVQPSISTDPTSNDVVQPTTEKSDGRRCDELIQLCQEFEAKLDQGNTSPENQLLFDVVSKLFNKLSAIHNDSPSNTTMSVQSGSVNHPSSGEKLLNDEKTGEDRRSPTTTDVSSQTESPSSADVEMQTEHPSGSVGDNILGQQFCIQAEHQTSFNRALNALSSEKNAEIVQLRNEVKYLNEQMSILRSNSYRNFKSMTKRSTVGTNTETIINSQPLLSLPISNSDISINTISNDIFDNEVALPAGPRTTTDSDVKRFSLVDNSDSVVVVSQPKNNPLTKSEIPISALDNVSQDNVMSQTLTSTSQQLGLGLSSSENPLVSSQLPPMVSEQNIPSKETTSTNSTAEDTARSNRQVKIALNEFRLNDLVLILFDSSSGHYKLFTVTTVPHFLHEESYSTLGLTINATPDDRTCKKIATFVNKEYCKVRKSVNRFNLEVGQKFYRVKVAPWSASVRSSSAMLLNENISFK